jgi:hypothetical protein
MFVRDNFVHGDLHGGNIMHAPHPHPHPPLSAAAWAGRAAARLAGRGGGAEGGAAGVVVIDAGLVTRVSGAHAGLFRRFLSALCGGDADALTDLLLAFRDPRAAAAPRDPARFRADVAASVARWVGEGGRAPDGGVISLGDLIGDLLFRLQQHKARLPPPSVPGVAAGSGPLRAARGRSGPHGVGQQTPQQQHVRLTTQSGTCGHWPRLQHTARAPTEFLRMREGRLMPFRHAPEETADGCGCLVKM